MKTLEQIKTALTDRRVSLVAEATGIHYNTIRDIRDGRNTNPNYKTLKALSDYLES